MKQKFDKILKVLFCSVLSMLMMLQYTSVIFAQDEQVELEEDSEQEETIDDQNGIEESFNEEETVSSDEENNQEENNEEVNNEEVNNEEENGNEEWVYEEFEIDFDDLQLDEYNYDYTDEELFMGYAQAELSVNEEGVLEDETSYTAKNSMASSHLDSNSLAIYNLWKNKIISIANGETTTTTFTLFSSTPYIFTYSSIPDYGKSSATVNLIHGLENYLLNDCPYALYWFDKCKSLRIYASSVTDTASDTYKISSLKLAMPVSAAYSATGEQGTYATDQTKMQVAINAAATAKNIVDDAAASCATDYEKLKYYRQKICDLTGYASSNSYDSSVYGDTWQLIYVFDGNDSTNVVCEGYSKAFQYLCDLTTFTQGTNCFIVTGYLEGGGHMWNVVTMDNGKHYLMDVTNCDTNSIGYPDYLFIAPCKSGSVSSGYIFSIGSDTLSYEYDTDTLKMYSTDDLTMSTTAYTPSTAKTYSVTYNANGGSGTMSSQTMTYGVSSNLTKNTFNKTGYTFAGWATSATGSVIYSNQASVKNLTTSSSITLYAVWTANSYLVTFNANGGSVNTASKTVTYNGTYGTLPTPTREGYDFTGWYTTSTGGTKFTGTSVVSITANTTLYAHWNEKQYTITFNANGGSVGTTSKTVTYNGTYGTLPTPTRSGYEFVGWYTEATNGNEVTSTTKVSIVSNQTLYAHYSPILLTLEGYSLTLDESIGVNFYFVLSDLINENSDYFVVTKPGKQSEKISISEAKEGQDAKGDTCRVLTIPVSAKDVTSTISFYVEQADGTKGKTYTYSVEDYANYIFEEYEESSDTYKIALSMMTYGYYTMEYFNSEANRPDMHKDLNDTDVSDYLNNYSYTLKDENEDCSFIGARLVLTSKPGLKLYFTGNDTFEVSNVNDGEEINVTQEGNYKVVTITNISDMSKMYVITTKNFSLKYGLFSYGKLALSSNNSNLKNLVKAMVNYNSLFNTSK